MTDKTFYEMDEEERIYRIKQSWRHLARRIFVYLNGNPDVLSSNNNQEVFDAVREIQIKYRLQQSPKYSYDEAAEFEDFMCKLQLKSEGKTIMSSKRSWICIDRAQNVQKCGKRCCSMNC